MPTSLAFSPQHSQPITVTSIFSEAFGEADTLAYLQIWAAIPQVLGRRLSVCAKMNTLGLKFTFILFLEVDLSEDSRTMCMWAHDFMTEHDISELEFRFVNSGWSFDTPFLLQVYGVLPEGQEFSERGKAWSASRTEYDRTIFFTFCISNT